MSDNIKINTERYSEEYLCNKCGVKVTLESTATVVCKACGSRIFRKPRTRTVIRIKAI